MKTIEIHPCGPIHGTIRPPGSKSITNRALVCAALAEGTSTLTGALDSDDTRVMVQGLHRLGLEVLDDPRQSVIQVAGCAGRPPAKGAEIDAANSGTTIRFLTAVATLGQGRFRLDGSPRMRQRPIGDLLAALGQLGADAVSEAGNRCPPVVIQANGLPGGKAVVAGDISSQFLSALLMAAPCAASPVELAVVGELVSQPYVEMTLAVMNSFGVSVRREGLSRFLVSGQESYQCRQYTIEPDASAASYFFAAAAVTGGTVTVEGLSRSSLQGDVAFCDCLAKMGCDVSYGDGTITVIGHRLHGIEIDMNAVSDTVQTLGAVALFAEGSTTITNVGHIRHKETDRLAALAIELRKLGAKVEERADGLTIVPDALNGAEIDTYDDHRMAMSMALVGLASKGVVIRDPDCTAKTYPRFFQDLESLVRGQTQ
ncbi:MAG: 3-phosphoshikimate 1-carboxyvinyltransferase [Rhodopirellula sp.]|nr:3-phosphoshikimate 1-carboxyvinyltransferase [Rhodopirellula sp.]